MFYDKCVASYLNRVEANANVIAGTAATISFPRYLRCHRPTLSPNRRMSNWYQPQRFGSSPAPHPDSRYPAAPLTLQMQWSRQRKIKCITTEASRRISSSAPISLNCTASGTVGRGFIPGNTAAFRGGVFNPRGMLFVPSQTHPKCAGFGSSRWINRVSTKG